MPIFDYLSGSANWNPTITTPSIGSPITAQSIADGRQDLLDNDFYLKNEVDNLNDEIDNINDEIDYLKSGQYAYFTFKAGTTTVNGNELFHIDESSLKNDKGLITLNNDYSFSTNGAGVWLYIVSGPVTISQDNAMCRFGLFTGGGLLRQMLYIPFYDTAGTGLRHGEFSNSIVRRQAPASETQAFGWSKPANNPTAAMSQVSMTVLRLGDY